MSWLTRLLLGSLLLCPLLGLGSVHQVNAQKEQVVSEVELEYQFGSSLQVSARINQPEGYSSFVLILQPDGQSSRQISITPGSDGRVDAAYDLTLDPLKPFARIYYWFELVQIDGKTLTTPSYWFDYLDDRFEWKTSETELFQIAWVEGDAAFGQKIQEIARDGLKAATTLLPVSPELPLRIYVYPDVASMQTALTLTGQAWTSGHASPDVGVILVSNDSTSTELIEMERQIPHELMHILEYQVAGQSYASIPAWLNEGLATSVELYPNPDLQRVLNEAQAKDSLLSLSSLCEGFPQDALPAQLAYAQSVSFVTYLNGRFGSDIFKQLLENASSNQTCANLVSSTLLVSLDDLQQDWFDTVFASTAQDQSFDLFLPLIIGAGMLLLAGLIILLRRRHKTASQPNER